MTDKFDELAKGLARSVTRRQAFKKSGVGVAGMVLASFGLVDRASAGKHCLPLGLPCKGDSECCTRYCTYSPGAGVKVCSPFPL